jgi:hypothetical protein
LPAALPTAPVALPAASVTALGRTLPRPFALADEDRDFLAGAFLDACERFAEDFDFDFDLVWAMVLSSCVYRHLPLPVFALRVLPISRPRENRNPPRQ